MGTYVFAKKVAIASAMISITAVILALVEVAVPLQQQKTYAANCTGSLPASINKQLMGNSISISLNEPDTFATINYHVSLEATNFSTENRDFSTQNFSGTFDMDTENYYTSSLRTFDNLPPGEYRITAEESKTEGGLTCNYPPYTTTFNISRTEANIYIDLSANKTTLPVGQSAEINYVFSTTSSDLVNPNYYLFITDCAGTEHQKKHENITFDQHKTFTWTTDVNTGFCSHNVIIRAFPGINTRAISIATTNPAGGTGDDTGDDTGGATPTPEPINNGEVVDPTVLDDEDRTVVTEHGTFVLPKHIKTPGDFLLLILNLLYGLVSGLALLAVVVGGVQYVSAGGAEDKAAKAKRTLTYAMIGIFLAIFAYILVRVFAKTISNL